ncbi:multidrug effflux MFS transporter [Endozoicomonas sp. GU-1]|uniref:multidrug effflux MFS transporter n=1 Tax=Endozoicomonas sp. GU-1 TaxID=3009078 RepID=UPI0022B4DC9C|nr:multidrug effflux MFS transporter [Endozoicomonas sp. GU-1]WBA83853.1 multidrug effflux MFS transporter [Endozoicomonas sp. GU-1]WBA86831.1 multidrug effflux MFS transporter [Endozoicomonas sp. GU-1]
MRHLTPEKHPAFVLIFLTLFAVVGPVSIDIFTPSLPAITAFFATTSAIAQWSVGLFMLGFSLSMLIVGPLADRLGRKKTLLMGYSLYLAATAITLLTDSIYLFIAARFAQAVFGCFGTAVARMMARDYYRGQMEVKMLAYIGGCLTIAPMAAPIVGGYLQEYADWQYSFYVMAAMAVIAILALTLLPEHKPETTMETTSKNSVLAGYKAVLTDARYLRFTIAAGAAFAGAFVFVAGGSFVVIGQLGISPATYGYLFAVAIASYLLSASMGPKLSANMSRSQSTLVAGSLLMIGAMVSLVSGLLTDGQSITGYVAGIAIYELGLGLFMPLCQARATEHMKENMGTAAGLIFFIEMLLATLISALIGFLPEAGTLSLSAITLIAVAISGVCLMKTSDVSEATPQAA